MARAAQYDRTGGPEVLEIREVAAAEAAPDKVVIRVRAAGLNPFDAKVRTGFIPSNAAFPRRIASDVAGTVTAVGEAATYWNGTPVRVGDEVLGRAHGSAADEVVASAAAITPRPEGLSVELAGALNTAGLTAFSVVATVPVGEGDTVLIGGASGAVGLIASQLAIAAGARVIGTGAEANHELLRSIGVEPLVYGDGLAGRVRELGQVTAVYDCHGRATLEAGIELGLDVNRMVAIAGYEAIEELGVRDVDRATRTPENLAILAEELAAGRMILPIAATFPLTEIADAFRMLESPHVPGKIAVIP